MTEINFYHLQKHPLEKTLPRLLGKVTASGKKAVVLVENPIHMAELDIHLWTYTPSSFLPHGSEKDGSEKNQPIWLTTTLENPNDASVLVITDGKEIQDFTSFEKCLDLFNGYDTEAIGKARQRWQKYQKAGHTLTYWFQNDAGAWQKKDHAQS